MNSLSRVRFPKPLRSASPALLFTGFLSAGFLLNAGAAVLARRRAAPAHQTETGRKIAAAFAPFAPRVKTRSDDTTFYVESDGMPNHRMMVGITNWQQQVPLPQSYVGANAWQFPLKPVPAANPLSGKDHFFRGAMAIADDGVPIFNALNNRGEDSYKIGELDEYGGHCGRADDYHYHVAPTYLQKLVGPDKPLGYALDGYPLYGLTEPDGSPVGKLDAFNGHYTAKLGYHYHATKTFPYLNGGFHGEVTERDGQVDPQPHADPIRPALNPLPGARITGFEQPKAGSYVVTITLNGLTYTVKYALQPDGSYQFDYIDGQGNDTARTYQRRGNPRNPDPKPVPAEPKPQPVPDPPAAGTPEKAPFVLSSPAVGKDNVLPVEFTGDGAGISPPLEWSGEPAGTRSFALIMHHVDVEGVTKWYWTLWNIPAATHSLPKNVQNFVVSSVTGTNGENRDLAYAPPHSKGPGPRTYTLTLYALAEAPKLDIEPWQVNRAVLLRAMKGHILGTAVLRVTYTRTTPNDDAPWPHPR